MAGFFAAAGLLGFSVFVLAAVPEGGGKTLRFEVDVEQVLRRDARKVPGINLNFVRDLDVNRPGARLLNDALKELGVKWLRYPGGEKSDFHLWSKPPYEKPGPVFLEGYGKYGGVFMDFDRFIAQARAIGAEPYVVAGYDSVARSGRSKAQWLEHAVDWVRYANVKRKYGVKYWEIGNENWNNKSATPEEMADVVAEFSKAMKAVDPAIRVGASGTGSGREGGWWAEFLPRAAPVLDFVNISIYNCHGWKKYDRFLMAKPPNLVLAAEEALAALQWHAASADRDRIELIVSEFNSMDFSEQGWPPVNTLGHALVNFDTLGRLLGMERVRAAMQWNTRWMDDHEAEQSIWYALGPKNELTAVGRALALWGAFLQDDLVRVEGGTAYASASRDKRSVTLWLLNKGRSPSGNIRAGVKSPLAYDRAEIYLFSGENENDGRPEFKKVGERRLEGNVLDGLDCPPLSVTVICLEAKAGVFRP